MKLKFIVKQDNVSDFQMFHSDFQTVHFTR